VSSLALNSFPANVVIYGGTGQAKVVRPILEHFGGRVVAVFDDTPGLASPFPDIPIYQGWESLLSWLAKRGRDRLGCCVAIGNPHGRARLQLQERLKAEGLTPVTLAHPNACIAANAQIGEGTQIMAGAVVGEEAVVGRACIINTRASIDHEDVLEDGVEVAPGATLCGLVRVGTGAWVCAGATILPRITIGPDAIVGAGAVVTRNVRGSTMVVGIPARECKIFQGEG
jgi:sugar O-acyltransferase (sialic acid O-acetyltransferase NeuD family)